MFYSYVILVDTVIKVNELFIDKDDINDRVMRIVE